MSLPRILLIDDNHDTLDLLEIFLYHEFEIMTAFNGFEGLKKAEEEIPDLVITDIMMPVMDGIRLFNSLRKQDKTNRIPVIAITSFAKKITRRSLLSVGFDGVVSKPLSRDAVVEAVQKVFARRKGESGARGRKTDGHPSAAPDTTTREGTEQS